MESPPRYVEPRVNENPELGLPEYFVILHNYLTQARMSCLDLVHDSSVRDIKGYKMWV